MTKTFGTEVLLSIVTGTLLCDFSDVHACCEFLAGEPIWTHQFAHRPFVQQLTDAVLAQHPQFRAVDASGVSTENWQQFRDEQVRALGACFDLIPMAAMITKGREAFTEPLKGKNVIVVTPEDRNQC